MPLVEIEEFNTLIDNKPFFDKSIKNKQEEYENLVEKPRKYDYNRKLITLFVSSKILWTYWHMIYQDKMILVFLNRLILQEN